MVEHLLLGLLAGKSGLAYKALKNQAVELLAARKAVQDCVAPEPAASVEPTAPVQANESVPQAKIGPVKIHPIRLPDFKFREPDDSGDVKMIADIRGHGWHVVFVPADEHGPGFAFTVGLYLRTLQPEILIMGVDQAPSGRVLNAICDYLMAGGELVPERRYPHFVDGREVIFKRIAASHYRDYLGCANWFYRTWPNGFPALQCVWPDLKGVLPHEPGFEEKFRVHQIDLSVEKAS
jgi:hypothetical protein